MVKLLWIPFAHFFYKHPFFELSLSVTYLFNELNLKCCLSVAYCNLDMILLRHDIFLISASTFGSWSIYALLM